MGIGQRGSRRRGSGAASRVALIHLHPRGTQWGTSYSKGPLYAAESKSWTQPVIPTLFSRVLFSTVPLRSTHRFLRVSASSIRTALIRRPCPQGKTEVAAGGPAGVGRQQPLHFAPDCQAVLGTPRPKERAQWNAPRAVILMPSS